MEQSFTILIAEPIDNDEIAGRIYEAMDDTNCGICSGQSHIHFDREAETLNEAIASAINDIKKIGLTVTGLRIDLEDLDSMMCQAPA